MKKTWKKIAAFTMAAALAVGSLAGCSSKPADTKESDTTAATTTAAPGESKTEATTAPTEASKDPVTITMVAKDMSADDGVTMKLLDTVAAGVSKTLGREVKIELAPISEGTYSESMSLLLQSGDIPDLMYFQGGDYQFAITQEILEDLRPYVEKSTYVKAMMQPFNTERMDNYPYLLWLSPDRIKVPVVRKDWLDASTTGKALLEDPTTDNYKAFFKELKDTHSLKAAFTVPGDLAELDTVFNLAFGLDKTWVMQDGAYVYSKVSNASKDKLVYYAELYKEGLLDNEWLTMKWDTKESAFYGGQVGVVSGTQGSVVNIYNNKMVGQNGEGAELVVLPPAKGVAQGYLPGDVSKESRGWAIYNDSENKDVVFAILEYMASPEGQILDKLGYEGEQYNITDGKYVLTDKINEWYPRFHESIVTMETPISEETPYFSQAALDSLDMSSKYASFDNAFVLPDDFVTNWDATEALYAEFAADFISGKKTEADFDAFVEEWNNLGGAEVTAYANEHIK